MGWVALATARAVVAVAVGIIAMLAYGFRVKLEMRLLFYVEQWGAKV